MNAMTVDPPRNDELAVRPPGGDRPVVPGGPVAGDERGRGYELTDRGVVVTSAAGRSTFIALDNPEDPAFLRLPRIDLEDGRPLRTSAFLVWSAHVRAILASGARFETQYRTRRPYHTVFGVAGGLLVGSAVVWLVTGFIHTPRRTWVEPSLIEWAALGGVLFCAAWVAHAAFSAAARIWMARKGSFLRVAAQGLSFSPNGKTEPFAAVRDAMYRPFAKVTVIELSTGARMVIPREDGPLSRPDLTLAAVDDGVRDQVLARL